eukprot:6214485-Pleurochrysis_carterae.AAC.3
MISLQKSESTRHGYYKLQAVEGFVEDAAAMQGVVVVREGEPSTMFTSTKPHSFPPPIAEAPRPALAEHVHLGNESKARSDWTSRRQPQIG